MHVETKRSSRTLCSVSSICHLVTPALGAEPRAPPCPPTETSTSLSVENKPHWSPQPAAHLCFRHKHKYRWLSLSALINNSMTLNLLEFGWIEECLSSFHLPMYHSNVMPIIFLALYHMYSFMYTAFIHFYFDCECENISYWSTWSYWLHHRYRTIFERADQQTVP